MYTSSVRTIIRDSRVPVTSPDTDGTKSKVKLLYMYRYKNILPTPDRDPAHPQGNLEAHLLTARGYINNENLSKIRTAS